MKKTSNKQGVLHYRMYGFVNYQLAGTVHAGIQFGHAVVEYAQKHFKDKDYQSWAKRDKTFIILNGGPTNNESPMVMQNHLDVLVSNGIKHAKFHEPDLNDALTAVVFLVDERVYNGLSPSAFYDAEGDLADYVKYMGGQKNTILKNLITDKRLI